MNKKQYTLNIAKAQIRVTTVEGSTFSLGWSVPHRLVYLSIGFSACDIALGSRGIFGTSDLHSRNLLEVSFESYYSSSNHSSFLFPEQDPATICQATMSHQLHQDGLCFSKGTKIIPDFLLQSASFSKKSSTVTDEFCDVFYECRRDYS